MSSPAPRAPALWAPNAKTDAVMLGEFLEISIHTRDILASIAFYEALGFAQVRVGEIWSHPYAVMTDGRVTLGLHEYGFPSPALTFVLPDLLHRVRDFEAAGVDFEFLKLGEHEFNEAGFYSPEGQMITLLEARTFSPPGPQLSGRSRCGVFSDYRLGAADVEASRDFWVALGMISSDLTARGEEAHLGITNLNLTLQPSAMPAPPALVFAVTDLEACVHALAVEGLHARSWPSRRGAALLTSPEGLSLLLESAED